MASMQAGGRARVTSPMPSRMILAPRAGFCSLKTLTRREMSEKR
jgi:hypothetical protein